MTVHGLDDAVRRAAAATRRLTLYHGIPRFHPVLAALWELVQSLGQPDSTLSERCWELARELTWALWESGQPAASRRPAEPSPTPWLPWMVEAILADDNPFARAAARGPAAALPPALREAAREDLRRLQALAMLGAGQLAHSLQRQGMPWPEGLLSGPPEPAVESPGCRPQRQRVHALHEAFARSRDWGELVDELADYHRAAGWGLLGRFGVLRWQGSLVGVHRPDPVRLEELVGYEAERGRVVANTQRFVRGLPAHHLLLYGPRGTGKSATVKALAHAFVDEGLRLVELARSQLAELPEVVRTLARFPQRFVLFVDDLSFEESEGLQRELKAALEGTVEQWPDNVVVYATSNRRHLVQERPSDDGLARPQDEINERISLADRFAVTVIFPAADQELYLRIVESLARRAGLPVEPEVLRQRALRWALWHNERSPRTAHQFVEELMGELGIARPVGWDGQPS